jgi:DNA helicase HerA-like ATPase
MAAPLLIAKTGKTELCVLPALANRHGLITGATGTGKTVTLQTIAQQLSSIGVPVFMADVKGDLSGIAKAGGGNAKGRGTRQVPEAGARLRRLPGRVLGRLRRKRAPGARDDFRHGSAAARAAARPETTRRRACSTWCSRSPDDSGMLLLDAKDLRAMLQFVGDNAQKFTTEYGNISAASIGAIQRGVLALESQGADRFFGEPMLNIADLMQVEGGKGVVNVLAADKLMNSPKLYATFLLWMLAELFEHLPEIGDPDKPKLVFFFDEAHLLFNDAPRALLEKVEQVVRLIRSKGVGVYFVTQNPLDIPESVLGQLGNRVQHALRAFTPKDQKAVKSAAETMRPNPKLKIDRVITELEVGEALVSFLDEKGTALRHGTRVRGAAGQPARTDQRG